MKIRHLRDKGIPPGATDTAIELCKVWKQRGLDDRDLGATLKKLSKQPEAYLTDELLGPLALKVIEHKEQQQALKASLEPVPYQQWGDDLEEGALRQMEWAVRLPVAHSGALMPDAHRGYGLPIGGVLATRNAVIPYAVGVDIACRMKMTVLDLPVTALQEKQEALTRAIEMETRFGMGASFKERRMHDVLDRDWNISPITKRLKDKAWSQLGTSGSGNHFVEFGTLTLPKADLGLEAGRYLALLSHSGSRGTGAQVAAHYSRLAKEFNGNLPRELQHLSWLDMDRAEGQEYWEAMTLMGHYAAANHQLIHEHMARHLGVEVLLDLENHHNFAWKEEHAGEDVIVHRKGATPAGEGVLGIIPGSMADPGFIVRGKGNPVSLNSASHGAGRCMSRTAANKKFKGIDPREFLAERGVTLLSAGLDELPMSYKNIETVMAAQSDLVDTVGRFDPKLVKMAPAGEKPED